MLWLSDALPRPTDPPQFLDLRNCTGSSKCTGFFVTTCDRLGNDGRRVPSGSSKRCADGQRRRGVCHTPLTGRSTTGCVIDTTVSSGTSDKRVPL